MKVLFAHTEQPEHWYPADRLIGSAVEVFAQSFGGAREATIRFGDGSGLNFRIEEDS